MSELHIVTASLRALGISLENSGIDEALIELMCIVLQKLDRICIQR